MRMLSGLIGSDDAVIADAQAEILTYLASFNDKILAVDMEAGGLSLARYEHSVITGRPCGGACQPERGTVAGVLLGSGLFLFGFVFGRVDP
jgi:hypothetical protein